MTKLAFLELLSVKNEGQLDDLIDNNILSLISDVVEFQSRAAAWYAKQLPPPRSAYWRS